MKAVIYLFTPKESDMQDRGTVRGWMANAGAGRFFWNLQSDGIAYSIPFGNFATLTNLLHLAAEGRLNFAKYLGVSVRDFEGKNVGNRRCLRIKLVDCQPQYDPRRFAHMNGREIPEDHFNDKSIGSITLMDADHDYKYWKLYFDDFFEAGMAISKVYGAEVLNHIPLQEPSNV